MSKECNRVTTIDYNLQTILSKEDSGLGAGGGVGYPPYISHTGMCLPQPHRVGFLGRFGLKTGIPFTHSGLELGVIFEGTTGVYERFYCFNSK